MTMQRKLGFGLASLVLIVAFTWIFMGTFQWSLLEALGVMVLIYALVAMPVIIAFGIDRRRARDSS